MQKPDAETTQSPAISAYDVLAWFEVNKKPVIWSAVGILAVVVAVYVYTWSRDRAEATASAALLALPTEARPESGQSAASPADLLRVAREHAGTAAGARARVMGAVALYGEGKYAEARREFEEVLRETREGPVAALGQFGLATCLDALDQKEEALAAYQQLVSRFPDDVLVSRAKIAAAALHEAKGQPEQALRLLEELSRPGASSTGAMEAAQRKQQLLQRHPQLVKTNPAPAVVIPTTEGAAPTNLDLSPPAGAPRAQ
ncbi:MAG: tetratricopeptide repeat protein [Verrucomicrobia bacterium]|nr:tetratricopeptide repeat protein [Verrucomicrobiota bacterium]